MNTIPSTVMRKTCLLMPLIFLSGSVFAESPALAPTPPPKILYVGSISINPCQDAKVLADWYAQLGIEMKEYQGEYYGKIETAAGVFAFGIHPKKADAPKKSSGSVSVVFRVENFDESLSSLKAKGLSPESIEKDPYGQFAHFHDPDGNEVSLWGK
jgi:predicted enzyme related to lactoylglutathione lyase